MPEGSVLVDGFDAEDDTEDQGQEDVNNSTQGDNTREESQEQPDQQGAEEGGESQEGQPPAGGLTDKGTKLDPNPMSALNQQLVNERAKVREYEAFMSDPKQVRRYLEELEKETGVAAESETDRGEQIALDQIQTREDVLKFLEQERKKDRAEIEQLKSAVAGFMQNQGAIAVGNRIREQIAEAKRKYPQLREFNADGSKNPDFDKELADQIGEAFEELDFDPRTQTYRGRVDFLKLAERFMKAAKRGQSQGSRQAQTVIQDRRAGRVVTGSRASDNQPDESKMSASQVIASCMQRAASKR